MNNVIISPSLLSADFANLERDIKKVEEAGADWLHVDVMDGHFVPNITIGVPVVASIKKVAKVPLDVHLMIEEPEKFIEPFAKAGADILTFHYEATGACPPLEGGPEFLQHSFEQKFRGGVKADINRIIRKIKSLGIKAGMSIKPKTSPEEILEFLPELDLVLVMTVEPGFGGQEFMQDCAEKLPIIRKYAHDELIIQVDGGINAQTAKICKDLGANSLVAGNYIFNAPDIKSAINSLR